MTAPLLRAASATLRAGLIPALLLAPAWAAPPADTFKDEVTPVGGKRLTEVMILTETYETVEWKSKVGAAQAKPAAEVAAVVYGDTPEYFRRGLDAWKAGRWAEAEGEFRGAVAASDNGVARPWCRARANAYIGDCQRRIAAQSKSAPAEYLKAVQSFEAALKEEPKSPVLDVALLGLAEALYGAGQPDKALKALDDLAAAARAAKRPLWEAAARRSRGRLLERKGDSSDAEQTYSALADLCQREAAPLPAGSPERKAMDALRVDALVRRAWAAFSRVEKAGGAGAAEAQATFDRLASETGGAPAGVAAARCGTGAVLLQQGRHKEALRAFIEVEVTGFAVPDEVARALWYKAEALKALGDAAGREAALKDLVEFYPWSDWANRAR